MINKNAGQGRIRNEARHSGVVARLVAMRAVLILLGEDARGRPFDTVENEVHRVPDS
jgi:hypothetical protein